MGIYKYTIFQVIERERPSYTYDKRVYTIEVYVDWALDVMLVIKDADGAKA